PSRKVLPQIVALLVGFSIIVAPWLIRNQIHFGRFSLSSIGDNNLYFYNATSLYGHLNGLTFEEAQQVFEERWAAHQPWMDRWPNALEGRLAREYILAHPFAFAFYNGVDALNGLRPGFSYFLSLLDTSKQTQLAIRSFQELNIRTAPQVWLSQGGVIKAIQVYMAAWVVVLFAGAGSGLWRLLAIERRWDTALFLILALMLLYLPGAASNARFRMPVEPLLALFAAYGLQLPLRHRQPAATDP
ncbi:MAG: hypothetical protein IT326_05295, partial [Anaerolineae bacterium]|nr:hypothetical protein [Anaerolineae bacterium]